MHRPPEERLKELLTDSALAPLALAESCTGGLVAARVTAVSGSSAYFDRGLVTYSNEAKEELLGIPLSLTYGPEGAVSRTCAISMLNGLFECTPARIAAAVTHAPRTHPRQRRSSPYPHHPNAVAFCGPWPSA